LLSIFNNKHMAEPQPRQIKGAAEFRVNGAAKDIISTPQTPARRAINTAFVIPGLFTLGTIAAAVTLMDRGPVRTTSASSAAKPMDIGPKNPAQEGPCEDCACPRPEITRQFFQQGSLRDFFGIFLNGIFAWIKLQIVKIGFIRQFINTGNTHATGITANNQIRVTLRVAW
jgi:hypothetical protein